VTLLLLGWWSPGIRVPWTTRRRYGDWTRLLASEPTATRRASASRQGHKELHLDIVSKLEGTEEPCVGLDASVDRRRPTTRRPTLQNHHLRRRRPRPSHETGQIIHAHGIESLGDRGQELQPQLQAQRVSPHRVTAIPRPPSSKPETAPQPAPGHRRHRAPSKTPPRSPASRPVELPSRHPGHTNTCSYDLYARQAPHARPQRPRSRERVLNEATAPHQLHQRQGSRRSRYPAFRRLHWHRSLLNTGNADARLELPARR
jgi:hypothetical protein